MSHYDYTKSRVIQWLGIILILGIFTGAYFYFHSQASTLNAPGGDPFTKGLVGYWKLDDGSGTNATDSSGNGNTGTLDNTPTWTTGQVSGALSLNGSNQDVNLGTGTLGIPSGSSGLTLSAWVNPTSFPSYGGIISKSTTTNPYGGWQLYTNGDSGNKFDFSINVSGTWRTMTGSGSPSPPAYTTNSWYLVMGTYDGTTMKLYVNGTLVSSYAVSGTIQYQNSAATAFIGKNGCTSFGATPYFNGKIDEVRLYNRALSANEVVQLYNLTAPTGIDTSLKGYWSFNGSDISGTTAYDRSGSGNNGTLTNGPTVVPGKVGQALSFDGSNDYVSMGNTNDVSTNDFTLSYWLKAPNTAVFQTAISKRMNGPPYVQYQTGIGSINGAGSTVNSKSIFFFGSNGSTYNSVHTTNDVVDGGWHFVTVTRTGSGITIFIDGIAAPLTIDSAGSASENYSNSANFIVANNNGTSYLSGSLDEVRFYNRALSASEVAALYIQGAGDKTNSSVSQPQGTGKVFSGLVDYWRFDDGSGTTATDSGTGAHNGTLTGGGFTWGTGQVNGGLDTTGAGYISTADTSLANNSFTISAWAKRTTSGTYDYIFAQGSSASTNNILQFGFRDSNVFMCAFYNNDLDTTGTYTDTNWHYWTCTYDAVSNLRSIYLDGVFLKSDTASADYQGSGTQQIGASFAGSLDEFRIYSRALSNDEVRQIYNLTNPANLDSSLKGYWSFNGQDISGTTAYDRSGAGNNGTLTNGPTTTTGKIGQALSFDGTNDYVSMGDPASGIYDFGTSQDFSLSVWAKSSVNDEIVISKKNHGGSNAVGYMMTFGSYSNPNVVNMYISDGTNNVTLLSKQTVIDNNWHYVSATFTRGGVGRLYVDGILVDSQSISTVGNISNSDSLLIGAPGSLAGAFFRGSIDEPRIYNRALSASEIQTLYLQGNGSKENSSVSQPQGTGRLDSGLAGYWKLDDGSGVTATDSSTNGNNGTLTNGPTWTTGQIGSSLNFFPGGSDTDAYTTMGDPASGVLDFGTSDFSIVLWMKGNGFLNQGSTVNTAISKQNLNAGFDSAGYSLTYNSTNKMTFTVADGTIGYQAAGTTATTGDGLWHYYVGLRSGSTVYLYVDGASAAQAGVAGNTTSNAVSFLVGGDSIRNANALIDEVRVYNRALSTEEIRQLYNLTAPTGVDTSLKGYWSFNGKDISGTTAYDRSGAGNNGTLTNGPTTTTGKIGQALSFDGTNDYVSMGDPASGIYDFGTSQDFSLSVWAKSSVNDEIVISKKNHGGSNAVGYMMTFGSYSNPNVVNMYISDGTNNVTLLSKQTVIDNDWHYVSATFTRGGVGRLYVDGILVDSQSISAVGNISNSDSLLIGAPGSLAGAFFRGPIDEPRIYNRALSASEIASLYNQGR